jgi:hypothetical protein
VRNGLPFLDHDICVGGVLALKGFLWPPLFRFGNKYFQNLNAEEEVPGGCCGTNHRNVEAQLTKPGLYLISLGRHRWIDFAQVRTRRS